MSLQFNCSCGRRLQVGPEVAGKRVRCPSCMKIVWAPAEEERVPEARLVDEPQSVPVTVVPPAAKAEAEKAAPRACSPCAGGLASGGFVISLGSLVLGVVSLSGLVTWIPLGLLGTFVSARALKKIQKGEASAAGVGLARAGVAIGMAQVILAVGIWAVLLTHCNRGMSRRCCGSKVATVATTHDASIPAAVAMGGMRPIVPPGSGTNEECEGRLQEVCRQLRALEGEFPESLDELGDTGLPRGCSPRGDFQWTLLRPGEGTLVCPVHRQVIELKK